MEIGTTVQCRGEGGEGGREGGRCVWSFAPLLLERDSALLQPCLQEKH